VVFVGAPIEKYDADDKNCKKDEILLLNKSYVKGLLSRKLMAFFHLSRQEQGLLFKAFCLSGVVRLVVLVLPFRWLSFFLGTHMRESPWEENDTALESAARVGHAVETASQYTPWESKCLVQAIVGKIMLRRLGIASTLYLGVGRDERKDLVAHAWLRCGEIVLTGGQGRDRFTVVSNFADLPGEQIN